MYNRHYTLGSMDEKAEAKGTELLIQNLPLVKGSRLTSMEILFPLYEFNQISGSQNNGR